MRPILTISLCFITNWALVASDCVSFELCPAAVQHYKTRRDDEESKALLRSAHCGFVEESGGGKRVPKVRCEKIPEVTISSRNNGDENCVYIFDCPGAKKLIESDKRHDPAVILLLRSSICGDKSRGNFVLCNRFTDAAAEEDPLPKPDQCGLQSATDKIHNGKQTDIGEFPWLALIQYINTDFEFEFGCHGSLIGHRYVLSAAHCVAELPRNFLEATSVVLGDHNIRTEEDCNYFNLTRTKDCAPPALEINIQKFYAHPEFDRRYGENDIALIRLERSVRFTEFVKPICLPDANFRIGTKETFFISGWGQTETVAFNDVKLSAVVFHKPKEDCQRNFRFRRITDEHICATSSNGSDTCSGDSGGPLMALQNRNAQFYVAGIASFGGTNCTGEAGVYVNVKKYLKWIVDTIRT